MRKYSREVSLIAFPWILLCINTNWLINKSDIDVWFYNGYFTLPIEVYREKSPTIASQYLDTRFPFTLLGHLIYLIFPDPLAKVVLNIGILHSSIILIVFFLMKRITNQNTAFIGSLLLTSNIYYLRMIGSDYVDLGVVFFLSIILLLISKTITSQFKSKNLFLLGSFTLCLLLTHPLSIFLLPLILLFGRAELLDQQIKISKNIIQKILCFFSSGVFLSLFFFQLIYSIFTGKNLFILTPTFVQIFIPTNNFQTSFEVLLNSSPWNRMFFFVLISSFLTLILERKSEKSNVQKFWSLSLLVFSTYFLVISPSSMNVFLSRDGLYVSFIFIFVYLSLQATLLRQLDLKNGTTFVFYLIILILTSLKLTNIQIQNIESLNLINSLRVTTLVSLSLIFLLLVTHKRQKIGYAALIILILFQFSINWKFDGNKSVGPVRSYILEGNSEELPFFFFNKDSPDFQNFASIPAAFSPKGWWKTNLSYPDCLRFVGGGTIKPNSLLVVIDRNRIASSENFILFKECLGDVKLQSERMFIDSKGSYYVAKLMAPSNFSTSKFEFLGFRLPTIIGNVQDTRMVAPTGSKSGVLTYGPYQSLPSGRYNVTIQYTSTSMNGFDVIGTDNSEQVTYKSGKLIPTNTPDEPSKFKFTLDLKKEVQAFEIRTFFLGEGSFAVHKISIARLD